MIQIIPNWHPIFVHFTLGLLMVSTALYLVGYFLKKENLLIAARWNLWIGAFITVGTVLAGFDAYNTVAHDGMSHQAMTDHRNWALPTAAVYLTLAVWSLLTQRGAQTVSIVFVIATLLASSLLAVTGFKGAEVVYRHGTGVMRIPVIQGDGGHGSHSHSNSHGDEEHDEVMPPPKHDDVVIPETDTQMDDHDGHDHSTPQH